MLDEASASRLVRLLRGGQITIPAEFRKRLGIGDDTLLRLMLADGELRMTPVRHMESGRGSPWLHDLYELFAPVRAEIVERQIAEAEVNADIDAAVSAVRAQHDAESVECPR